MTTVTRLPQRCPHRAIRPLLALALLIVSFAAATVGAPGAAAAPATTTAAVNLRSGPGTNYDVILVVPAGAYVEIVQNRQNGFYRVRYNGRSGWVSASYLSRGGTPGSGPSPSPGGNPGGSPGGSPGSGSAVVTSALNLRAEASTSSRVLAVMPAGATVTLTGQSANGFQSVRYNGLSGWAYASYLSDGGGGDGGSAPPAPPPGGAAIGTARVTSALNLRAGPSTADRILAVMPSGATVDITGDPQNGFYPVSYGGRAGWAAGQYLDLGGGSAPPPGGGGGSGIAWPFESGAAWTIIQGYNGGTHQNRSATAQYYYGLDLARADGNSAGQAVLSPVSGTIRWLSPSSGGILIDMGNGYGVAMFHATFVGLSSGQSVAQGQYLGTISGPGGNGYAVTPHLEIDVWQLSSGGGRSSVPFTGANAISGSSFPDVGGSNQYGGTVVWP